VWSCEPGGLCVGAGSARRCEPCGFSVCCISTALRGRAPPVPGGNCNCGDLKRWRGGELSAGRLPERAAHRKPPVSQRHALPVMLQKPPGSPLRSLRAAARPDVLLDRNVGGEWVRGPAGFSARCYPRSRPAVPCPPLQRFSVYSSDFRVAWAAQVDSVQLEYSARKVRRGHAPARLAHPLN
jgi:hypothetical protein